jgi:hypothetical protein
MANALSKKDDPKPAAELLMLHMEVRAIRDRVVADLDAALAKIERALPPRDDSARNREMSKWDRARWRHFRETGR